MSLKVSSIRACDEAKAVPSDVIGWGASVKVSTGSLAASYKCASRVLVKTAYLRRLTIVRVGCSQVILV